MNYLWAGQVNNFISGPSKFNFVFINSAKEFNTSFLKVKGITNVILMFASLKNFELLTFFLG